MKKLFTAVAGLAVAAFVVVGPPAGAQTATEVTGTIVAAPDPASAGQTIVVTATFSTPQAITGGVNVSITYTGSNAGVSATPTLVSATSGLSSCIEAAGSLSCTWSVPTPADSPQTIVASVTVAATPSGGDVRFAANATAPLAGSTPIEKAFDNVTITGGSATTTAAGATTTAAATTTVAPTTAAPPPTEATIATTTTAAGTLPATGSNSNLPVVIGLVAVAAGVLLIGGARVRRSLQ